MVTSKNIDDYTQRPSVGNTQDKAVPVKDKIEAIESELAET